MSGAVIAQLVGLVLALVLVTRGIRARRTGTRRTAILAGVWIAIIVVATFLVTLATSR